MEKNPTAKRYTSSLIHQKIKKQSSHKRKAINIKSLVQEMGVKLVKKLITRKHHLVEKEGNVKSLHLSQYEFQQSNIWTASLTLKKQRCLSSGNEHIRYVTNSQ